VSVTYNILEKPKAVIFSIAGKITTDDDSKSISESLDEILKKGNKQILFDLSELEFITSSGLNFFIRCLTKIRNADGELVFCGVHGFVEKLFSISKLNEIFIISPTSEEGLLKFTR
jgi:anti-anti-sigma factor